MEPNPKPVLLGYQSVARDASEADIATGRRVMEAFAEAEGCCLGTVFVDADVGWPLSGFLALVEEASRDEARVKAVVVPSLSALGRSPRVRAELVKRLHREAGIGVLSAVSMLDVPRSGG